MDRIFKLKSFDRKSKNIVSARVNLNDNKFNIFYHLEGDLNLINIPDRSSNPARRYNLWEHTCFELFLKKKSRPWYIEFNFAPNGNWNSFYMKSYRDHTGEFDKIKWQEVSSVQYENEYIIESSIMFNDLEVMTAEDFKNGEIEIGITAVIERIDHELEYFALCHLGDKPDFHKGFIDFL